MIVDAPLWAFVHVPKTAGSSINRMLSRWAAGQDHVEQFVLSLSEMSAICTRSSWVSGHVPYPTFLNLLRGATSRPIRFVTAVREPTSQIASHYNWLIEIYHRGSAFYADHPPVIREISQHIRSTDNSDPSEIAARLLEYSDLFLNQQSRIVLGADVQGWSQEDIVHALRCYDMISTEGTVPLLVELIAGSRTSRSIPRENESGYHFDRHIFQHPHLEHFLAEHHRSDYFLYEAVKSTESPSRAYSAIAQRPTSITDRIMSLIRP